MFWWQERFPHLYSSPFENAACIHIHSHIMHNIIYMQCSTTMITVETYYYNKVIVGKVDKFLTYTKSHTTLEKPGFTSLVRL